ncbi:hypothetical protein ALP18_200338 [Pseudomonas amygdali pv. myricae]|nr:hypothetical protein ALP18_200338 [Pseudomonas amygdali pv. myricae]
MTVGPYNRSRRVAIDRLWTGIYRKDPDLGALIGDRLKVANKCIKNGDKIRYHHFIEPSG